METSSARNYVSFQPRLSSSSSQPRFQTSGSGLESQTSLHHSNSAAELGQYNPGYQSSEPLTKYVWYISWYIHYTVIVSEILNHLWMFWLAAIDVLHFMILF